MTNERGLTRIDVLGQLVSIGTLLAFVLVSLGIIILRKTMPDAPRPFRTPGSVTSANREFCACEEELCWCRSATDASSTNLTRDLPRSIP